MWIDDIKVGQNWTITRRLKERLKTDWSGEPGTSTFCKKEDSKWWWLIQQLAKDSGLTALVSNLSLDNACRLWPTEWVLIALAGRPILRFNFTEQKLAYWKWVNGKKTNMNATDGRDRGRSTTRAGRI